MTFGIFPYPRKDCDCIKIPEDMYKEPFDKIIACMSPHFLEDSVVCYFDELLPYRKASEYKYFKIYPRWEALFAERLNDIMGQFKSIEDFKTILEIFPEYTFEVYTYWLQRYLNGMYVKDSWIYKKTNLVEDLLIPMSDFENYQYWLTKAENSKFSIVRERAYDILDCTYNYAELWDVIQVLEQYFDIPSENFDEYVSDIIEDFINGLTCDYIVDDEIDEEEGNLFNFDYNDYSNIKEFFKNTRAYKEFMDHLLLILSHSGLELYTLLIRILGPIPELVEMHDYCAEFLSDEEKHEIDDFFDEAGDIIPNHEFSEYDEDDLITLYL